MTDAKVVTSVVGTVRIQSCEKDHCPMGRNLSWALKKSWDFSGKPGGAKPQGRVDGMNKDPVVRGTCIWVRSKSFSCIRWSLCYSKI